MTEFRGQIRQLHLQLPDGRQAQAGVTKKALVARGAKAGVASDRPKIRSTAQSTAQTLDRRR